MADAKNRGASRVGKRLAAALHGLWQSRGGGFYALGTVTAFLWLEAGFLWQEAGTLYAEWHDSGAWEFFYAQAFDLMLNFAIESMLNGFQAVIWPLYLFQLLGIHALWVIGASYVVYAIVRTRLTQGPRGRV